jgi:hypothetical protein
MYLRSRRESLKCPSVPLDSHRWTDFQDCFVNWKTLETWFIIPTTAEDFPLFRYENATTVSVFMVGKFQHSMLATCALNSRNIGECFKTKIIDFKESLFFLFFLNEMWRSTFIIIFSQCALHTHFYARDIDYWMTRLSRGVVRWRRCMQIE